MLLETDLFFLSLRSLAVVLGHGGSPRVLVTVMGSLELATVGWGPYNRPSNRLPVILYPEPKSKARGSEADLRLNQHARSFDLKWP